jgi:hypothetical protein
MGLFQGKQKRSVLAKQKPKKTGKKKKPEGLPWQWKAGIAAVVFGLGLFGTYKLKQKAVSWLASSEKPIDWRISLKPEDGATVSDQTWSSIYDTARKTLARGSADDLRRTAAAIQRLDAFARVSVVRLSQQDVAIEVRARQPVLCVKADQLRLVGAQGEVFGSPEKDGVPCPGPTLSGVFAERASGATGGKRFTLAEDFTLDVSPEEREALKEAVALQFEAKHRQLVLRSLDYQKFRGFLAVLTEPDGLELELGRAPFGPKLEKLSGLLQKLREKGEQAQRIELDYQGKAFIKLKKM